MALSRPCAEGGRKEGAEVSGPGDRTREAGSMCCFETMNNNLRALRSCPPASRDT